ncbi:MAG: hypothetical protein WBP64_18855 [Nitrososphaeraceae archaeon]
MISLNQKALVASNNKSSLANNSLVIQDTIDNLNGLLNEAVSARVMKDAANNSTNQALVLGNIGNPFGFPQAKLAKMVATMNITALSGNMNTQGKISYKI